MNHIHSKIAYNQFQKLYKVATICLLCIAVCLSGFSQAPVNDDPCNAITLTVGPTCSYQTFTNANATPTAGVPAPGCGGYQGGDVWFKVTVPCTGSLVIDGQTGVVMDAVMEVYSGNCSNLTAIDCDDDDSQNGSMPYLSLTGLTPQTDVWIRIWEYGGDNNGTFGICITEPPPPGPGGNCLNALPFCTSNTYTFPNNTNVPSLGGSGIYDCLLTTPNPVWYYMQVQNPGDIIIGISQTDASGNGIDVDYAVWGPFTSLQLSCPNLSLSNNISCSYSPDPTETATILNAQAGEFYILLLTNYENAPGTISFHQTGGGGSTNCAIVCNITAGNSGPVCPGGTFDLTATGVTNATYSWVGPDCFSSTLQNPANITASTVPGSYVYTVTATTASGSQCIASTTVVVNSTFTGTATVTNTSCTGSNDGSLTIIPSPAGAYTYTLMPGNITQPSPTFSGLAAGNYSVTFTTGTGCSGSVNNINVGAGSTITAGFVNTNTSCNGATDGTITVTPAIPGIYTYTLNPGAVSNTTGIFTNLAANTYSVTLTNSTGCSGTVPAIIVSAGTSLSGTFVKTNTSCPGINDGTITISPAIPGTYNYTLNPGAITQPGPVFTGLSPDTYTVTFTNAAGCQGTLTPIVIAAGPAIAGTAITTATSCPTVNNGTITVIPEGTGPYTFTLNPGNIVQSSPIFSNLAAGTYTITFITAGGCSGTISTNPVVAAGAPLTSTFTYVNPPCSNINNGSITIIPTGTAPYTFVMTGPGGPYNQSNPVFTNLSPGTYNYTFTDASGCSGSGTNTLVTNSPIIPSIVPVMPLCNGSANGTITASASGGVATYQYSIDGGTTYQGPLFSNLIAGAYTIRVKDNAGCTKDTTFTLSQPTVVSAGATTVNATCNGNDGTITVTGAGGTPPYQYSIDNGSTYQPGATFTAPAVGPYSTIKVKDANGCVAGTNATVGYTDNMTLFIGNDTTICAGQPVTLQPQTNPGTSVFQWTPATFLDNPAIKNPKSTPLSTITYTLNAAYGPCTRQGSITITVLKKPVADAGADVTICDKDSTVLTGSASNLSGTVNYVWTPSSSVRDDSSFTTIAIPASTQTYTLTVTDNYGCNFSVTDEIMVTVQPPVPAFAGNDTIAMRGVPHQLTATGGNYYIWNPAPPLSSPFSPTPLATLYNDTRFTVQVTDIAGCKGYDTIFVKVYEGPAYYIPNAFSPNGDGLNDIFRPVPAGIASTDWFRVFNRYGQLVFETNEWLKGWDGTFKGKKQPLGIYVWMIKGKDKAGGLIEMKGTVMLIQ